MVAQYGAQEDDVRALVLSGGGVKIHYHVGAIQHLMGELERSYSIFAGVSAGALVSAFLAQYRRGHEVEASATLVSTTLGITESDVYRRWRPFGLLHGLIHKPSFYNSQPLRDFVERVIDPLRVRTSQKALCIGAVNYTTGKYQLFREDHPYLLQAVLASSAFPGILEPVELNEELWVDGGVRTTTPLHAAILCGATEVDVVVTSPAEMPAATNMEPNAMDVLGRSLGILMDEVVDNDLKLAQLYNALVVAGEREDKRFVRINVIRPAHTLTSSAMDFDADANELRSRGYEDAMFAVRALAAHGG